MQPADEYTFLVKWSEEDDTYVARCLEFPLLATHGNTKGWALLELETVLSFCLSELKDECEKAPPPLSEKELDYLFNFRK